MKSLQRVPKPAEAILRKRHFSFCFIRKIKLETQRLASIGARETQRLASIGARETQRLASIGARRVHIHS